MMLIKEIDIYFKNFNEIISLCIGNLSETKLKAVCDAYLKSDHKILGCIKNNHLIGIIGFYVQSEMIEMRHVAVSLKEQHQGIGRLLVEHLRKLYKNRNIIAETDRESIEFYLNLGFTCRHFYNQGVSRYHCLINPDDVFFNHKINQKLNQIAHDIHTMYGIVSHPGHNFGEPAINSGPCGVFADVFYQIWNSLFKQKVNIVFIIEKENNECWHVLIKLPNAKFFDGGIGIHDQSKYNSGQFYIQTMERYDRVLLDKHSYGLDRQYPIFCPSFSRKDIQKIIFQRLKEIKLISDGAG